MQYKEEAPIIFDEHIGVSKHPHDLTDDDRLMIESQAYYNALSTVGDLDNWKRVSVKLTDMVCQSRILVGV